jgi:type VII secretion-associated serine protease mycosin
VKHRAKKVLAALTGGIAAFLVAVPPASADSVRDRQWHLKYLNVAEAHAQTQGDGVIVAVVDTGVNANHPDLVGNVLPGVDITGATPNGSTDTNGHGTGMAGLIVGHGHGGSDGVLGIAPKARIFPVRDAEGKMSNPEAFVAGVNAAAKSGAKVICIAEGGSNYPGLREAIDAALAADVVVVAAIGNKPGDLLPILPAAYDGVVAVGAVGQDSNLAAISVTGNAMVLSAPGMRIVSTDGVGGYRVADGTSDSTAIVAGAAALVRSKYPNLSAKEVIHRLTATATDKGAPGRDPEYGYGVLNLVGALTANVPPETPGTATTTQPTATAAPTGTGGAARPDSGKGGSSALPLVLLGVGVAVLAAGGLVVWLLVRRRQAPTVT